MNAIIPDGLLQDFVAALFTPESLWVMATVYVICEAIYALPKISHWKGTTKQAVASVLGAGAGFLLLPSGGTMALIHGLILGFATTKVVARLDKYFGTTDEKEVKVSVAQ